MSSESSKEKFSEDRINQNVGSAGRDVKMIGKDNIENRTFNFNLWISIILILSLGGIAVLGLRLHQSGIEIQIQNEQQPSNQE